jgi:hypothetical protein
MTEDTKKVIIWLVFALVAFGIFFFGINQIVTHVNESKLDRYHACQTIHDDAFRTLCLVKN